MSEYYRGYHPHRRPIFKGPKECRTSAWGGTQNEERNWAFSGTPITESAMDATRKLQDPVTGLIDHAKKPDVLLKPIESFPVIPTLEFAGTIPFAKKGAA